MSEAIVGALRVNLGLDSSAFNRGLAQARASLQSVGKSMTGIGKKMSAGVTAPLAGIAGLTLKTAGDFEASMNRVSAALGSTDDEFAALRQAARDMGATTQFSATQAAEAIETLAKNGVSAADILGGALKSSLTLAAASGTDLAQAGDIATDVMANFGKEARDLGGVVDGITGTLIESKFGVDDYRRALGQAGGVAGSLGVEFEDFNAVIAATSSAFASGSDAGTSFKTFLQRLVPNTKEAAEKMKELGIEFFDAQGNLKSMTAVAAELQDGLAGLSEEAQSEALKTIFGSDAVRTAVGLMREGADGIKELNAEIANASASKQAEARMEGLNGTLRELRSAFEELQLAIADSGLLDAFTDLVRGAAELVRWLGDLDPKILKAAVSFGAIAGAIGPLLIPIGLLVTAFGAMSAPILAVTAAIAGITAAAIAFSPELKAAKDAVLAFGQNVRETVTNLANDILVVFEGLPEKMIQVGKDILDGLWQGLVSKYEGVKEGIGNFATGIVDSVKGKLGIQSPSKVFKEIGRNIMEGLGIGVEQIGAQVQARVGGVFDGVGQQVQGLVKGILTQTTSLRQGISSILGGIADRLFDSGFNALWGGLGLPKFAQGTNFASGGLSIVGERGPELVNLPRGSQVIPNHSMPNASQIEVVGGDLTLSDNGQIMAQVRIMQREGQRAYDGQLSRRFQSDGRLHDPRAVR